VSVPLKRFIGFLPGSGVIGTSGTRPGDAPNLEST
jgi:hypothetical protein